MTSESSSPEMRERILQQATRLFAQRGYGGTSVQAVADAVGIRKPSLLYWFPSKEALRQRVVEGLLAHWKREIPQLMAEARSGHDRFSSTITALVAYFAAEPDRARLMLREVLDRPDATRALMAEHLRPWATVVTDYIRMGQELGRVHRDVDPEAYVVMVVTMVLGTVAMGGVTASMFDGASAEPDPHIAELVRIARSSLFLP
jgi:TetR/AcrR family transcriptional regulator